MRVLMLPAFFGGVSFWRFELPARHLRRVGVDVTLPTADECDRALREYGGYRKWIDAVMPQYDIIHVGYCPVDEFAKALFIARDAYHVTIITDVDDNIKHVPPYSPGWKTYRVGSYGNRVVQTQLRHSDAVTVSTQPLADDMRTYNERTVVAGNWIDPDDWRHPVDPTRDADQSVRLMFRGGQGRYGDWQVIREPIERVMAKFDGTGGKPMLRLFFLGATPDWAMQWMPSAIDPSANRCFYLQTTQHMSTYIKLLQWTRPDIVVGPVECNQFNVSKSSIAWQEATLAGAAFICTDWPTYGTAPPNAALKLDNTTTQWCEGLEALITDAAYRSKLHANALQHVLDNCQAKEHIGTRLDFYREACAPSMPTTDTQSENV